MYSGSSLKGVSWKAKLFTRRVELSSRTTSSVSDTIIVSKNLFKLRFLIMNEGKIITRADLGILIPTPSVRIQRKSLMKVLLFFLI